MLNTLKPIIQKIFNPAGFNVEINIGETAGQTIQHVHIHLIPRYKGDFIEPGDGIRGMISEKEIIK